MCATPPARPGAGKRLNLSLCLNYLPPSGGDAYGGGDFGDTGLHLTLYPTPTYTAITPSGGHREGGTVVTIDGYGFDDLEAGFRMTLALTLTLPLALTLALTLTLTLTRTLILTLTPRRRART